MSSGFLSRDSAALVIYDDEALRNRERIYYKSTSRSKLHLSPLLRNAKKRTSFRYQTHCYATHYLSQDYITIQIRIY